ncbi:MAG: M1 family aminopeptidase [Fidelibacterota bacterium]
MKHFSNGLILLFIFLVACQPVSKTKSIDYPNYDLKLKINPATKNIQVTGELTLPEAIKIPDSAFFYLQRNLAIKEFSVNGKNIANPDTAASDNRFMPQARKIYLEDDLPARGPVRIQLEYEGKLDDLPSLFANRISEEWTEIGLYYPWFPFNPDFFRLFTYTVEVETYKDHHIFGIGEITKNLHSVQIKSAVPTTDMVICMTEDIAEFEMPLGNNSLRIFHQHLPDTTTGAIANNIQSIKKHYENWFGAKNIDITIIDSKRTKGGGYARIGGIVFSNIDPEGYDERLTNFTRYFAHELAHLWWFRAKTDSWQDWLNESFAEYSALMVLRETFGEQEFQSRMAQKQKNIDNTPPVWGLDRNGVKYKIAYNVLYNKGPVLLYQLEKKTGKEKFMQLGRKMAVENINTTDELLTLLSKLEGPEVRDWFEDKLKNY